MPRHIKTHAKGGKGKGDIGKKLPTWAEYWIAEVPKDDTHKIQIRRTEAQTVAHEIHPINWFLYFVRVVAATTLSYFLTGIVLNTDIYQGSSTLVDKALCIVAIDLAVSRFAGPYNPSLFTYLSAIPWSMVRLGSAWEHKLRFFLYALFLYGILCPAAMLLGGYFSYQVINAVMPNVVLTIPAIDANLATHTQVGTVFATLTILLTCSTWFGILGVGESDGTWLSYSDSKANTMREEWTSVKASMARGGFFLVLALTTGLEFVFDPMYVLSTYWQNTSSATNDYPFFFWVTIVAFGASLLVLGVVTYWLVHYLHSDVFNGTNRDHFRRKMKRKKEREEVDTEEDGEGEENSDDE